MEDDSILTYFIKYFNYISMDMYDDLFELALNIKIEKETLTEEIQSYIHEMCTALRQLLEQPENDWEDDEQTSADPIILSEIERVRERATAAFDGIPFLFLEADELTLKDLNQWRTIRQIRRHFGDKNRTEKQAAIESVKNTFRVLSQFSVQQAAYIDGTSGSEYKSLRRRTMQQVYNYLIDTNLRRKKKS